MTSQVTAVVVTYQSQETIAETMDSLKNSYAAGLLECIVVDNNSQDSTLEVLDAYSDWATIIPHPDNVGFGRGCNLGLDLVETEFVVFVNPDSTIDVDSLRLLIEFVKSHPRAGLVSPAISEPDGVQGVGNLTTPWNTLLEDAPLVKAPERLPVYPGSKPFRTNWVNGAIMLGRTDYIRRLKGFDPRFFLYFEETDLCRRILDEGEEIWSVGEAVAYHIGAASSSSSDENMAMDCIAEHYYQSRFYYLYKHHGAGLAVLTEFGTLFFIGIRSLASGILGRKNSKLFKQRLQSPMFSLPPEI